MLATAPFSFANELEGDGFSEDDLFNSIPQVFSATQLPQKITEAPAAITVIDRNTIEAAAVVKLTDLFRLVPGMQSYDIHSNKHGVTYHGLSNDFPNRLEVMVNGRSVYIPLLSTVAWETLGISLHDVDYIEVIRGSNVPTQGSNAFLGSINIITRSAVSEPGTEIRTLQGDLSTHNYSFRHADKTGSLHYALSGGRLKNSGIDRYEDGGLTRYIQLSGSIAPNISDRIEFEVGFNDGYAARGDGDDPDRTSAGFVRRDHSANYQYLTWQRLLDGENDVTIRYHHNYLDLESPAYSDDEIQSLLEDSFGPLPAGTGAAANALNAPGIFKDTEHGEVDQHTLEYLRTFSFSPQSALSLGAGVNYERVRSPALLENPGNDWVDERRWNLFSNWEYKTLNNWVFNTGAMIENSSIAGTALSPRLAANYLIDESSAIRAAYTIAHRMPSLLEANANYILTFPLGAGDDYSASPNRDVRPERINSFELGYFKHWQESATQLDLRLFYEEIDDAIDSYYISQPLDTIDGRVRISDNRAQWINRGLEVQLSTRLPFEKETRLLFNYGLNESRGERDRGLFGLDSLDERAPVHTLSVMLSTKPTASSIASAAFYYMDHTEWLEGFSKNSPRRDFTRVDIKLANTFNLTMNSELEVALIVQNLFDNTYSEFYRYNEFERRGYLQLKLSY